jgi:hypothetical protein
VENKRHKKLQSLLAKLQSGKDVQNRDLRTWLGQGGYARYEAAWQEQLELRKELEMKPDAVTEYEKRFRDARFLENKANGYAARGNMQQARKFRADSEVAYERLLEFFQEQLHADPWLRDWFDRFPENDPETAPSLIAECMPHVVSSRSANCGKTHHRTHALKSKHDVKIDAVEQALAEYEVQQVDTLNGLEKTGKLRAFLDALERDRGT